MPRQFVFLLLIFITPCYMTFKLSALLYHFLSFWEKKKLFSINTDSFQNYNCSQFRKVQKFVQHYYGVPALKLGGVVYISSEKLLCKVWSVQRLI
jgi:hypothetical protein